MPLRYVLWDNDGVLVDSEGGYFEATRRALAECGVTLGRVEYHALRAAGESAWDLPEVLRLGAATIQRHRAARDEYYRQFIQAGPREIPGVRAVLDALAASYRMAIVTTSLRRNFELLHAGGALTRHMEFVLTREDFVEGKPAPDGYLAALERLRAKADEAVVIEDSAQGLASAHAAGIRCVIVRNQFFSDVHAFDGADAILDSIEHLPATLERMAWR
ncbi:MAG TPA: HAD family hydrolase [Pseudomonadales bacterium]